MNGDNENRMLTCLSPDFAYTSVADSEGQAFDFRCESMGKKFWRRLLDLHTSQSARSPQE